MTITVSMLEPPRKPPVISVAFSGDESEELGNQIASLTLSQAVQLSNYLEKAHVIKIRR